MTSIPLVRITENEKWTYLEHGGLHGSELYGTLAPEDEHDECVGMLLSLLAPFGKNGIEDDCAYFIDEYADPDFFPCVEIADPNLLTLQIIAHVSNAVSAMPKKYRVHLCNALGFWNEDVNVIVEHGRIYWYAESEDVARGIGVLGLVELAIRN